MCPAGTPTLANCLFMPPPAHPCRPQNMRLQFSLAPDAWPMLQRLQRGALLEAALQAHLLPGSSVSRGLHVQLAVAAAPLSAPVPVGLRPAVPDDSLAAGSAQRLEVAVGRAPAPASLAHLLAATATAQPDGAGGLLVEGTAVTPAPIIDFKPLLPKRLAATPLAQRLQEQLRGPSPSVQEVRVGQTCTVHCMPAHLPPSVHVKRGRTPSMRRTVC